MSKQPDSITEFSFIKDHFFEFDFAIKSIKSIADDRYGKKNSFRCYPWFASFRKKIINISKELKIIGLEKGNVLQKKSLIGGDIILVFFSQHPHLLRGLNENYIRGKFGFSLIHHRIRPQITVHTNPLFTHASEKPVPCSLPTKRHVAPSLPPLISAESTAVLSSPSSAFNKWKPTKTDTELKKALLLDIKAFDLTALGKNNEAKELLIEALEIYNRLEIESHPNLATTLNSLGYCYTKMGNYDLALRYFYRAHEVNQEFSDICFKAIILLNIGRVQYLNGVPELGLSYLLAARDIFYMINNDLHPQQLSHSIKTLNYLAEIYHTKGDIEKAAKMQQEEREVMYLMQKKIGLMQATTPELPILCCSSTSTIIHPTPKLAERTKSEQTALFR